MANGNGLFSELAGEARYKSEEVIRLLAEMTGQLDELTSRVQEQVAEEQYAWLSVQGSVDVAGTDVEVPLQAPLAGSAWIINQIALTGTASGPCAIYFDSVLQSNLVYFAEDAGIFSDSAVNIYVPQNRKLVFHFYSQSAGQVCTANIQVRRLVQKP